MNRRTVLPPLPTVSGWLLVGRHLPADDGLVLGFVPDGDPDQVWPVLFEAGEWFDCDGASVLAVTHWMPMPEPPA